MVKKVEDAEESSEEGEGQVDGCLDSLEADVEQTREEDEPFE